MARLLPILLLAALAAGCGASEGPQSSGGGSLAQLTIRLDQDGAGPQKARELKLSCDSEGDSKACGAAAGLQASDFAAVPGDAVCTDIFGGPQTATISGELRGTTVTASLKRANGCEIKRWDTMKDLLAQVR